MELSLADLKSFLASPNELPYQIGKAYLIRTISYHWVGRVKAIVGKCLILEEASWVADTGRYSEATMGKLTSLPASELEPVGRDVIQNTDHITDAVEYPFQLPKVVK